jgi:hypothetical protein
LKECRRKKRQIALFFLALPNKVVGFPARLAPSGLEGEMTAVTDSDLREIEDFPDKRFNDLDGKIDDSD